MLSVQRLEGWTVAVAPFGDIGRLIGAIGHDAFVGVALDMLDEAVGIDHMSIIRLRVDGTIDFHGATSVGGAHLSEAVARQYLHRFNHLDPIRSISRVDLVSGAGLLVRLHATDVPDPLYRQECYVSPGIGERLTLYAAVDRHIFQVNLYRRADRERFDDNAKRCLVEVATVLLPSVARHAELMVGLGGGAGTRISIEALRHRVEAIEGGLSKRELEVCARALYGQSVEGTALELGIGRTSVVTYRRRAYAKLGISSQNELFALTF